MSLIKAVQTSVLLVLVLVLATPLNAQSPPDPNYVRQEIFSSYSEFKNELLGIVNIVDPVLRASELDTFWTTLTDAGQVPYAQDNQVAFLYRGSFSSVSWPGDFNAGILPRHRGKELNLQAQTYGS